MEVMYYPLVLITSLTTISSVGESAASYPACYEEDRLSTQTLKAIVAYIMVSIMYFPNFC